MQRDHVRDWRAKLMIAYGQARWLFAGRMLVIVLWVWSDTLAAQTLQLPTFHYFSVNTSVLVPDRGATMIGGGTSGSWVGTRRSMPLFGGPWSGGPLRQWSGAAQSVEVSATVLDNQAMDAALRAQARDEAAAVGPDAARQHARQSSIRRRAARMSRAAREAARDFERP